MQTLNYRVCEKVEVTSEGWHGRQRRDCWGDKQKLRWLEGGGIFFTQPS